MCSICHIEDIDAKRMNRDGHIECIRTSAFSGVQPNTSAKCVYRQLQGLILQSIPIVLIESHRYFLEQNINSKIHKG